MSVINAVPLLAAAGGDYQISRSVRLRSSASAYFNRTPASAGNRKTWTWSGWVKRGNLSNGYALIATTSGSAPRTFFVYDSDSLWLLDQPSGTNANLTSTAKFRDPSAWYHVILSVDTTQATSTNRVKMYVNGVAQTISGTYPTQNTDMEINRNVAHTIGSYSTNYFDGYLTEINFIDGQALTPSSFGENDSITGVWKPKKYAGTYGTNGFYLNFSDNSSNTATTIGKDYSGNGNNWTPNNISVTSGVTYDSMIDVPTLYGDGGNGRGNYAVINPLAAGADATISNANLSVAYGTSATVSTTLGSFGMTSGQWYWENTVTASSLSACTAYVGLVNQSNPTGAGSYPGATSRGWSYYSNLGYFYNNGSAIQTGLASFGINDVIGVAFDADAGTLKFYKNNTQIGTTITGIPADTYYAAWSDGSTANTFTIAANFGQRPFTYTPPSGFKALNTQNLPDSTSTIKKGNQYFDATTYTGNGSTKTITNSGGFTPDLVWHKGRSVAYSNSLVDAVRGNSNILISNTTDAESNPGAQLDITTGGFISTYRAANLANNQNADTYVAWQWKANGAGSTNSNGTAKSSSVTVDSSTDTVTWNSHGMSNGQKIGFFATTMPGGLSAGTLYYVRDAATNTFKVAASSGGAAIDITSNGTTVTAHTTLTSTVSANTTAGFSIVTYTGTGANATVEHGLGVAPSMVIVKCRNAAATSWAVYHANQNATPQNGALLLESTAAYAVSSAYWNNTAPTSSLFTVGTGSAVNTNTNTYVAYCWAAVAGYSAFGSYTGNGSSDGPFVYCGFRPAFVTVKRTDTTGNWCVFDNRRLGYNGASASKELYPNLLNIEGTSNGPDQLSNGFKLRDTYTDVNASGGTYIYAAFAENPFKNALAR